MEAALLSAEKESQSYLGTIDYPPRPRPDAYSQMRQSFGPFSSYFCS